MIVLIIESKDFRNFQASLLEFEPNAVPVSVSVPLKPDTGEIEETVGVNVVKYE